MPSAQPMPPRTEWRCLAARNLVADRCRRRETQAVRASRRKVVGREAVHVEAAKSPRRGSRPEWPRETGDVFWQVDEGLAELEQMFSAQRRRRSRTRQTRKLRERFRDLGAFRPDESEGDIPGVCPALARVVLRHGSDSRVDCAVVTVGDHRDVCSPQPAAADSRPPALVPDFAERTQRGLAARLRRIHRSVDRRRPHHFRERGDVRRGGIRSPAAPRGSGQEAGDLGEAFRRTEVPGRPACDIHRACARAGRGARARQPAPLTARMMGHGLGLAAQHYAERDGLKGAALRPAGGGISW